jgi:hypothetical protein
MNVHSASMTFLTAVSLHQRFGDSSNWKNVLLQSQMVRGLLKATENKPLPLLQYLEKCISRSALVCPFGFAAGRNKLCVCCVRRWPATKRPSATKKILRHIYAMPHIFPLIIYLGVHSLGSGNIMSYLSKCRTISTKSR